MKVPDSPDKLCDITMRPARVRICRGACVHVIKVLFVDDDARLRDSWGRVLANQADIQLVGVLERADQLTDAVRADQPDVVILDLTMPGRDPVEACRELTRVFPSVKVFIYSGLDDSALRDSVFDAGAWGYIDKLSSPDSILETIRAVVPPATGTSPVQCRRPTSGDGRAVKRA